MKTQQNYNTKSTLTLFSLTIICAFLTTGCSSSDGGNTTIDSSSPTDSDGGVQTEIPVAASAFRQIQDTVFTPICAECHRSRNASAGLRLDEGASFAALVGIASTEVPMLNRVTSGDPDNSYLVQKIEGTAAIGERMPLGRPPLPDETIQLIRDWISNGAQPETTNAKLAARVASTSVTGQTALPKLPEELVVVFNEPVDSSTVNSANFSLKSSGGDGVFTDGNEIDVPFSVSISSNGLVATMKTSQSSINDVFQLRIAGDSDNYVIDSTGEKLDGDSDGVEGGNYIQTFTVQK